eukprot:EST42812.1 Dual specificity phosphatase [Spironucleus salmonicida]
MNYDYQPSDPPMFMANRVLDNVFVGSHYAADDEDFIFSNSISRVINSVAHQVPNRFQQLNIRYLSYQFDQAGSSQIFDSKDERITQIVRFINEAVEQDSCVLIHSQNGDSRSIILMAAYLIHRFHWPPHRALQFIATKRTCSKPHPNYVKQLHEFANRRRAKYGEFKDIFGNIRGLKLNFSEILHRNTFLNAIQSQDQPDLSLIQQSPIDALIRANIVQKQLKSNVSFRDGLQTAQIPSQYANFDQNGKPVNPNMCSQLFRPRTPSYQSNTQVRCLPVRLDTTLLPAVSFDLDIQNSHTRRPDGYLQATGPDCQGYAVCAIPVSILRKQNPLCRSKYDPNAVICSVADFETKLKQAVFGKQGQTQVVQQTKPQLPSQQRQQDFVEEFSAPPRATNPEPPINVQQRVQQQPRTSPAQGKAPSFSRIRPPTPPRVATQLGQAPPLYQQQQQSQVVSQTAKVVPQNRPTINYRPQTTTGQRPLQSTQNQYVQQQQQKSTSNSRPQSGSAVTSSSTANGGIRWK